MTVTKSELKEIRVYEEDGWFWLGMTFIVENERSVKRIEVPKVFLGINNHTEPVFDCDLRVGGHYENHIRLGSTSFKMEPGETSEANHVYYTVKTLLEKPTKMTVAEIEKKLGYKIEIVSEKENDES